MGELPLFDDAGLNLADPLDSLGRKSEYISLVQKKALGRHVGRGSGRVLDLGCGFGRMTAAIADLGWDVIGTDPSLRVLRFAAGLNPKSKYAAGSLPFLPFRDASFDAVFLLNVVRPLHLLGVKGVCSDAPRLLAPGGRLIVLDNVRRRDARYVEERWFSEFFSAHGLALKTRIAIRGSRWPMIYLIRYGLIPRAWFSRIAEWELWRMSRKRHAPFTCYHNVLYIFERS